MLEQIIEKLGYNPFTHDFCEGSNGWACDDRDPNPFGVLSDEELDYIVTTERKKMEKAKESS